MKACLKRNTVVGLAAVVATVVSGICCFEGALFGEFSAVAKLASTVMLVMWSAVCSICKN